MMEKAEQIVSQLNWLMDELQTYEDHELAEKKTRLKAVSKSIETLQRGNLSVPVELTRMHDTLQEELNELDSPEMVFSYLYDELHIALKRISKPSRNIVSGQQRMYLGRLDRDTPHFTRSELEPILIEALQNLGGSASKEAVEDEIEHRLHNEFSAADLDTVGEGIPRWKKNVQWIRFDLVKRGIMKKDSPYGVWALNK
jgi:hypothetical protein